MLHFFLESCHKVDFGSESVLLISALALFLFSELPVTGDLLLHDLFLLEFCFLDLTFAEELNMFLLESLIHVIFSLENLFALNLLLELAVKFLSDKALSLSLPHDGLLLLLVVKEGVELLNGGPFVVFSDLRVDFGLGGLAGANGHAVEVAAAGSTPDGAGSLGGSSGAGDGAHIVGAMYGPNSRSDALRAATSASSLGASTLTFAVVKDVLLLHSEFGFLVDLGVEGLEVVFGESAVFKETLHFVVDVFGHLGVSVLELKFVDKHSLELLALLDVHKPLAAGLRHFGGRRRGS